MRSFKHDAAPMALCCPRSVVAAAKAAVAGEDPRTKTFLAVEEEEDISEDMGGRIEC